MRVIPHHRLNDTARHAINYVANLHSSVGNNLSEYEISVLESTEELVVSSYLKICNSYKLHVDSELLGTMFLYTTRCDPRVAIKVPHIEINVESNQLYFSQFRKGYLEVVIIELITTSRLIEALKETYHVVLESNILKTVNDLLVSQLQKEHMRLTNWDYEEND